MNSERPFNRMRELAYIGVEGLTRLRNVKAAIFGLGNIGFQTAYHMGLAGVSLTLVDWGRVEPANVLTQGYFPKDVGRPKVEAVRERLQLLNPDCQIETVFEDLKRLGTTAIRANLYLCCLDSMAGRVLLQERARWTDTMWLDGAIDGTGRSRYGKVTVFDPRSVDSPCYLCAWDIPTFRRALQLERERADANGRSSGCGNWLTQPAGEAAPTLASSSLGALIASVQSMVAIELLLGNTQRNLDGTEFVAGFTGERYGIRECRIRRNARCFAEHGPVKPADPVSRTLTLAELFDRAEAALGGPARIRIHGREVVLYMRCAACGSTGIPGKIAEALQSDGVRCSCGGEMSAAGHDLLGDFDRTEAAPILGRSLMAMGVPEREIVTAKGAEETIHFVAQ